VVLKSGVRISVGRAFRDQLEVRLGGVVERRR
jgi:hypothetical protein